jgi:predicted transposase YbfD/YdcC
LSKKTVASIIERGGDYVIALKGNQKKLHQYATTLSMAEANDYAESSVQCKGRQESRVARLFSVPASLSMEWSGLQTIVRVQRFGVREGKRYSSVTHYISSLHHECADAAEHLRIIRAHRGIESRAHFTRDVVLHEDKNRIRHKQGAANMATVNCCAMNILTTKQGNSITKAQRMVANKIDILFDYCSSA